MSLKDRGSVRLVSPETLRLHRLFLIKHTVPLANQPELLQGPLDEAPLASVKPPGEAFATQSGDTGDTGDTGALLEYPLAQRDPIGERKVSVYGHLLYGAHYLYTTFSLARHGMTLFVLVRDLMAALHSHLSEAAFLQQHPQLLPLSASPGDVEFLHYAGVLPPGEEETGARYITARAAFVVFGAATVASGHRVADDYWETLAKQQGMSPHHRVYTVPRELLQLLYTLQPALRAGGAKAAQPPSDSDDDTPLENDNALESGDNAEAEVSPEAKREYLAAFAQGEHVAQVMPGQGISDPLELSAQFRVPKYHSKNSFLQATQAHALDLPIGLDPQASASVDSTVASMANFATAVRGNTTATATATAAVHTPYSDAVDSDATTAAASPIATGAAIAAPLQPSRPMSRMLSNLLDSAAVITGASPSAANDPPVQQPHSKTNAVLNINGWKFETLPLRENPVQMQGVAGAYSLRGLPVYTRDRLLRRLRALTPNQIRELEYSHDAVVLNTGVQRVRTARAARWQRYWCRRAGVPQTPQGGFPKDVQKRLVRDVAAYRDVREVYNAETHCDEVHTTVRVANANLWGCGNVGEHPPPYAASSEQ